MAHNDDSTPRRFRRDNQRAVKMASGKDKALRRKPKYGHDYKRDY